MDFSLPIRVRWDVDFQGRIGRTKRIARQIREVSPLCVELRIEGEKGLSHLTAVFHEIHRSHAHVEATIDLFPGAERALRWGYPIDLVWEIGRKADFAHLLPEGATAVAFTPDEETLPLLPEILDEFAESRAQALHLPNVNAVRALAAHGHVPLPRPGRYLETADAVARAGVSLEGKRLVVHDYFLWKILRDVFPREAGERLEYAGCQGGSALAYVDWEGNVYPCDSLPLRLGSILDASFEQVWRSPARVRAVEAIRETPAWCASCTKRQGCMSGCRGLAYIAAQSFDAPDPACDGRRDEGEDPGREGAG